MLKVAVRESPDLNALAVTGLHAALATVMMVVVMVTVVMIATVAATVAVVVVMVAGAVVGTGQRRRIDGRRFGGRWCNRSRRIMRMMMIRRVTAVVSI